MDVEPIEGEALGVEVVDMFMEFVYAAMCTADTAGYVANVFASVVDCLAGLGLPEAEMHRYRAAVGRATSLVTRMESDATAAASLAPAYLLAAAFDSSLSGYGAQWNSAVRHVARIDDCWDRLTGSAVPVARRATSLAFDALAHQAYRKTQPTPAEGGAVATRSPREDMPADVLEELFADAARLLATGSTSLVRHAPVPTRSARAMLMSLVGVVTHLQAQAPAMMTVFPVARPRRFVRFIVLPDGTGQLESVGDAGLDKTDRLTAAQKKTLVGFGFAAPTRRRHERNWHLATPGVSLTEIPVLIAQVLERVHGLTKGERLKVFTSHFDGDHQLGYPTNRIAKPN